MEMKKLSILAVLLIGFVFAQQCSTSDMVGYWRFEESSGAFTADLLGQNCALLQCVGTCTLPSWTTGKVSNALNFDGVGDYLSIRSSDSLNSPTTELSFVAWVKINSIGSADTIIEKKDDAWSSYELTVGYDGRLYFAVAAEGNGVYQYWRSTSTLSTGTWYHVVATWKKTENPSTDGVIYINGVDSTEVFMFQGLVSSIGYSDAPLDIGRMGSGPPRYYFHGILDEVAIYNRSLTGAEVSQLYQRSLSGLGYCDFESAPFTDSDHDGVPDGCDNCPTLSSSNLADQDDDWIGDVCDPVNDNDYDNDSVLNEADNCPTAYNPDQADSNSDGAGDACQPILSIVSIENGPSTGAMKVHVAMSDPNNDPLAGEVYLWCDSGWFSGNYWTNALGQLGFKLATSTEQVKGGTYSGKFDRLSASQTMTYKELQENVTPTSLSFWVYKTEEPTDTIIYLCGKGQECPIDAGEGVLINYGFYLRGTEWDPTYAGKVAYSWGSLDPSSIYVPYNYNEWTHLELRNIDWDNREGDFYLNGVLVAAGQPLWGSDGFGRVRLDTYGSWNTQNATYFDDFEYTNADNSVGVFENFEDVSDWVLPYPLVGETCYMYISAWDNNSPANVEASSDFTYNGETKLEFIVSGAPPTQDSDHDGWNDNEDNCPTISNPDQLDSDSQNGGDVCDVCPMDATDTLCVQSSSRGETITSEGGIVATPDGGSSIEIPAGTFSDSTSTSITGFPNSEMHSFQTQDYTATAYSNSYDYGPAGMTFSPPVTITIQYTGYSGLGIDMAIYWYNPGTGYWEAAPSTCTDPDASGAGTCTAQVDHFSKYVIGTSEDTDNDGIKDNKDQCKTVKGVAKYNGCPYGVLITAVNHTVDQRKSSTKPASSQSALMGQTMRLYKKSDLTAAGYTSVTWKDYYNIINSNVPYAGYAYAFTGSPQPIPYTKCVTGAAGCYIIGVPNPDDYYVISEEVTGCQADVHLGSSISAKDSSWSKQGYVQTNLQMLTTIKKDGSSKCDAATSTVVTGSDLEIIQPEYVLWDSSQEIYPFVLSGDGDWKVDITPYVPAGYIVSPFNVIEVVSSETKAVAFTVSEVGSKPSDTTVVMTLTHNGKKKSLSLKVGGKDSNSWAAKKNARRPLLSAFFDLQDGTKETTLLIVLVAAIVAGYYLGTKGKKK